VDAKPQSNPLVLPAIAAAIAVVGAIYQLFVQPHLHPLHFLRLGAFLIFLVLYFLRSRFAWHAIVVVVFVVTPLYVLLPHMQSQTVRPEIITAIVILSLICLVYVWRVRRPYFAFVQRDGNPSI